MRDELVVEFGIMLQRLCTEYDASIYPGYIDDEEEELGIILSLKGELYSLESASRHHIKLNPLS